jgi:hypothetical protein
MTRIGVQPRNPSTPRRLQPTLSWVASVLALLIGSTSCATFSEPYSVSVKNDLPKAVTLAVCDSHDCSKMVDPWLLKPGQAGAVNVEVNGGYNPAIILGPDRAMIGCLPLRLSKRPRVGLTVRVSEAVACRSSSGIQAANGEDWPDPNL